MASLTLGEFELINPVLDDWDCAVMAEGTSWGVGTPIEVEVTTWLQNGAVVVTEGHENREVMVRVRFYGSDLYVLNDAEGALFAELEKPNALAWSPDDGPTTVFDVVTSSLIPVDEQFVGETQDRNPWRTYTVRLLCKAFTRSATETVVEAIPSTGSTTTNIDTCSAATGWTGFIDGVTTAPASSGGLVSVTGAPLSVDATVHTYSLVKTFAQDTSSLRFLVLDLKPPVYGQRGEINVYNGAGSSAVHLDLLFEGRSPVAGCSRFIYRVDGSTLTTTRIDWTGKTPASESASFGCANVAVSDELPVIGTTRQQGRSLLIGGATPTPGTLSLQSETSSLGDVLVYVYASDDTTNGYQPAMSPDRIAGATQSNDATAVSGKKQTLATALEFERSVKNFPQGRYLVMARVKGSTDSAHTFALTAKTYLGGNGISDQVFTSGSVGLTTAYQILPIGVLTLPTTDLDIGSVATTQIAFSATDGSNVTVDEVWLFNADIGTLVQAACATGTAAVGGPAKRLWVEPPTLAVPRPRVRVGHSSDKSDSYFVPVSSWDFPEFKPPQVNVFAVSTGASEAALSLSYTKSWHTNAAE